MRKINPEKITRTVAQLCVEANCVLRPDVLAALRRALIKERDKKSKHLLRAIISNAAIARKESLAICQDTGLPCVFIEVGNNVRITGDIKDAVQRGVEQGYRRGFLRNSIIKDPLARGRPGFYPAVIHIDMAKGNRIKIIVLPKGFGCENKSRLKMFNPTAQQEDIKKFIVEAVKSAGPDACPPYVVGVGIGGSADYACLLAKKALLRKLSANRYPLTAKLERETLLAINKLNIGPMGLGGRCTCLAVNIETYPTHIAGLPVAVNISCHALRSAAKIL